MSSLPLNRILGILIISASIVAAWIWMEYSSFAHQPMALAETGQVYVIEPNKTLKSVSRELAEAGLIDSPRLLVWMARLRGDANHIRVGEYELAHGTTPAQFLDMIIAGRVKQYSLTLVEGWNIYQVLEAVHSHEVLSHSLTGLSPQQMMAKLGYEGVHPEGRFYPDTYYFSRGMSDVAFLRRAYDAMEEQLQQQWQQRETGLPYKDKYEALTMASIVEKETGVPYERPAIAGVFVRRLQKGMRLQTDPTVIYGLGLSFDGNLKKRHLLDASNPYNTYKLHGLPPTPIAMPGLAAIQAALHPEHGTALYFVSRGDGSHFFSSTLEQHNKAVVKYQLNGKRKAFSSMRSDGTAIKEK